MVLRKKRYVKKKVSSRARPRARAAPRRGKKLGYAKKTSSGTAIKYNGAGKVPFPDVFYDKFRTEAIGLIAAGGTTVPLNFNATGGWTVKIQGNTIIQPFLNFTSGFYTVGGGVPFWQAAPMGVNQLVNVNLYHSYLVMATKMELSIEVNQTEDSIYACICPWQYSTTFPNGPADYKSAINQKGFKEKVFVNNSGGRIQKMTYFIKWNEFYGVDKTVYNNDTTGDYGATWNASPGSIANLSIFLQTMSGLPPGAYVPLRLKMTHYIKAQDFTLAQLF